jgi:hypothetical protein
MVEIMMNVHLVLQMPPRIIVLMLQFLLLIVMITEDFI